MDEGTYGEGDDGPADAIAQPLQLHRPQQQRQPPAIMNRGRARDERLFRQEHQFYQRMQQQAFYPDNDSTFLAQPAFNAQAHPSHIPVPSHVAANFHAFATNIGALPCFPNLADPNDFCLSHLGAAQTSSAAAQVLSPDVKDSMASALPSNRYLTPLRSDANGNAPQNPSLAAGRNALRSARSISNPLDDKPNRTRPSPTMPSTGYGSMNGGKQTVKDLKKRFDQVAPAASQTAPSARIASGRITPLRESTTTTSTNGQPRSASSLPICSSLRSGSMQEGGNGTPKNSWSRGTQRPKYLPEDQLSSNTQSFASRVSKPRDPAPVSTRPAKSMTQLSLFSSAASPSATPPSISRQHELLFGEILPEQAEYLLAGYGTGRERSRSSGRDSGTLHLVRSVHNRSFSDPDIESVSAADWYRDAASQPPRSTREHERAASTPQKTHTRAQSDQPRSQPCVKSSVRVTAKRSPDLGQSTSAESRLPMTVKKSGNLSSSTSSSSTRSNSPSVTKHTPASDRTSRQHGAPPVSRAKTPVKRSATPCRTPRTTPRTTTRTPVQSPDSSRKAPPSVINTTGNARLNAYVSSAPPPKMSPNLRSSRPRQSVATATTTASRLRALSPAKTGQRTKDAEDAPRRRKIAIGPVDFAKRRETIKLAYSKSIRESLAREARDAAMDKRKKELEAVAKAKVEAEAAAVNAAVTAGSHNDPAYRESLLEKKAVERESLRITTDMPPLHSPKLESKLALEPLQLVIPGSFPGLNTPSDGAPHSAVSTTTVATEFDVEPQTEAPTQILTAATEIDVGHVVSDKPVASDPQRTPERPSALTKRASYHSPFEIDGMSDDSHTIKILLDPSVNTCPLATTSRRDDEVEQAESTDRVADRAQDKSEVNLDVVQDAEAEVEHADETEVPGACRDDYESQPYTYTDSAYETTITILGPDTDFQLAHEDQRRDTKEDGDKLEIIEVPSDASTSNGMQIADGMGQEQTATPPAEVLERLEEFYVGPAIPDNIVGLRESTFSSSDVDTSCDAPPSLAEFQKTPDTSHSLTVPSLLSPTNRLSQFSTWTDFSLESSDERDTGARASLSNIYEPEIREQSSIKQTPSAEAGPDEDHRDSTSSQPDSSGVPDPSGLDDPSLGKYRLPELDPECGFSVPYYSHHVRRSRDYIPALPEHVPPLAPPENYEEEEVDAVDTRPSSYLHSQTGDEDDSIRPLSTAQSSTHEPLGQSISLQSDSQISSGELCVQSEMERRRLKQRQLVIKELIDTETVFIRDMTVVEEIYKGTAEACPKLDNTTVKLIFRNSDDVIAFHTFLLAQLKEGVATVYIPKSKRTALARQLSTRDGRDSDSITLMSNSTGPTAAKPELSDEQDRLTVIGEAFIENIEKLKMVHEAYLKTSDSSMKRLVQIQEDPTVKVWLNECNEVAKDLTSAWNLDSLLIKPMQRITKYPDIITHLLKYTPDDHPDHGPLLRARTVVMNAIDEINKTKKNFELVGQIVSQRKRKDSDVRVGLARAFGKRVDKLQASKGPPEDEVYVQLHEKFNDDYLRLQVVLRDVEYYTRTVSAYVHEFLQYLSSIELVMRLQPSKYHAHLESKWVQFNVSMRDIEKIALDRHIADIRKHVIQPFEQVISCYANPTLAMKKRAKRRMDYERHVQLKANNKKIDKQLSELVEQYEALNEALKRELPQLSALTAKIGNICLGKLVSIQTAWYHIWQEKMKMPLAWMPSMPDVSDIIAAFERDFRDVEDEALSIGILNPSMRSSRPSQSTTDDSSSTMSKTRSRPSEINTLRGRGGSIHSDPVPSLPTPDFARNNSAFSFPSTAANVQAVNGTTANPADYYRDYHVSITDHSRNASLQSPMPLDPPSFYRTLGFTPVPQPPVQRPGTGRSYESSSVMAGSTRRESRDCNPVHHHQPHSVGSTPMPGPDGMRTSGVFHSAMPIADRDSSSESKQARTSSALSSRESSSERLYHDNATGGGFNVLWLAASLFEFNIATTKHEAGYPYLTYQAGEIFDVIAEKGELWLAKNQDDPDDTVGWIWSKHFAKLADS